MVQIKPHSQPHAISIKDLQMFSPIPSHTHLICHAKTRSLTRKPAFCSLPIASPRQDPSYIILVNSGMYLPSLPRSPFVAGWFWAVILFHTAQERMIAQNPSATHCSYYSPDLCLSFSISLPTPYLSPNLFSLHMPHTPSHQPYHCYLYCKPPPPPKCLEPLNH